MSSTHATAQNLRDVGPIGQLGAASEADRVAIPSRTLAVLRERGHITADEASTWQQSFVDRAPRLAWSAFAPFDREEPADDE